MEKILEKIWCEKLSFENRSILNNSPYEKVSKELSEYLD